MADWFSRSEACRRSANQPTAYPLIRKKIPREQALVMAGGGSWISAAEQRRAPPFSRLKAVNHLARGDYSEGLSGLRAQHAKK